MSGGGGGGGEERPGQMSEIKPYICHNHSGLEKYDVFIVILSDSCVKLCVQGHQIVRVRHI